MWNTFPSLLGNLASVTNRAVQCLTAMIPSGPGSKSHIPRSYVFFFQFAQENSRNRTYERATMISQHVLSKFKIIISCASEKIYIPWKLVVRYFRWFIPVVFVDPNTDNFMTFAILHFYNFILVIDTTVQNNDIEISLHFKPMKLIFMTQIKHPTRCNNQSYNFVTLSYRHCSTCFGHYHAHHQEPSKPTTAENTSTSTFIRKPEAATAVWRAPDDGHNNARNMLSIVCKSKQ